MAAVNKRQANSAGISYQELISRDVVPPPRTLTLENRFDAPPTTVPVERYTSQAFHELEKEKLWQGCGRWRAARRTFPKVGDYTSCTRSRLVDPRRAHRARHDQGVPQRLPAPRPPALRRADGNVSELRCPFHGFSWNLDG